MLGINTQRRRHCSRRGFGYLTHCHAGFQLRSIPLSSTAVQRSLTDATILSDFYPLPSISELTITTDTRVISVNYYMRSRCLYEVL